MKPAKIQLGERIKEIRKAKGLTQEQLAELVDIEQKHVSRIELGKNAPTIDRLEMIAKALNVPMGSFFESGNQEANAERVAKIERMVRDLDEDYHRIILKFSQILKEFNEK